MSLRKSHISIIYISIYLCIYLSISILYLYLYLYNIYIYLYIYIYIYIYIIYIYIIYIYIYLYLLLLIIIYASFRYQMKKNLQISFCLSFTYFKMQGFLTEISLFIVSLFEKYKQIIQLFDIAFHSKELNNCF